MNNDREYSFPQLDTLMSVAMMVGFGAMAVAATLGSNVLSVLA